MISNTFSKSLNDIQINFKMKREETTGNKCLSLGTGLNKPQLEKEQKIALYTL